MIDSPSQTAADAPATQASAPDLERLTPTLGLEEAAKLLHCHPDTVRKMASAGKLPGTKVGRSWVFHTESLLSWIEERCKVVQPFTRDLSGGAALAAKLARERAQRMKARRENTR